MSSTHRFGFVTLLGRPNIGKSTLLNRLVGKKISITSHRPQTTRHRLLGIRNDKNRQIVFVDTPGVHSIVKKAQRKRINQVINKTAVNSLEGVDLVIFMLGADGWREKDEVPLRAIKESKIPVIVALNKLDMMDSKNDVLPIIEDISQRINCLGVVPISALKGDNVDHLLELITEQLPFEPAGFDSNQITDRSNKFLVTELVREQLFRLLGEELPYATAVELQRMDRIDDRLHIGADIWVDRDNHKGIVIGKQGEKLKKIGAGARKQINQLLGEKVHLELFVKVRKGWSDSQRDLSALGYDEGF
jgi:GTP-binding protein Era